MSFKPINTKEELETILKDRLDRERAKYADYDTLKKRAGEADSLERQLTAVNGELEKLRAEAKGNADRYAAQDKTVAELTERAAKAEKSLLRRKVAEEEKLPAALADRLTGDTEEELRKDAKALGQYVGQKVVAPLASPEGTYKGAEEKNDSAYRGVLAALKGE